MELGILIAIMVFTVAVMLGMVWVFRGWLKQRSGLIDKDLRD